MNEHKQGMRDDSVTIQEYMEQHIMEIANERGWDCKREGCPNDCKVACTSHSADGSDCRPTCKKSCLHRCEDKKRVEYCPRMREYCRHIAELQPYLDKDMREITFDDVKFALTEVRAKYGYADATIHGIQSCISVIFSFAEHREGIYNIMKYISCEGNKKDIMKILISGMSKKAIRCELQELREKHKHLTKSLTTAQLEKLTQILWDSIEKDGRYCMLVLMLYMGIRPAESRAVSWGQLVPFIDHPERWILNIYRTRDKGGTLKDQVKTPNAFRRIPLHYEAMTLMKKRKDFVVKANPGKDISGFPVCCLGNSFDTPCNDSDVSWLADKVFSSGLKLKRKDMYIYMLEAEIEKLSDTPICGEANQQLTLYVLRRAFWTWCESLTQLSDFEKRYIMGHDMKTDNHSVHSRYNDENLLWEICQKMDRCVLGKNLHEKLLDVDLVKNSILQIENRGLVRIHLTREMLSKGGTLQCIAATEEPGEAISLLSLSPLRKYGQLVPRANVLPIPTKSETPIGINCEYENWLAHQKYANHRNDIEEEVMF